MQSATWCELEGLKRVLEHLEDPYPSKKQKQEFVEQSGGTMTLQQVRRWFKDERHRMLKKRGVAATGVDEIQDFLYMLKKLRAKSLR